MKVPTTLASNPNPNGYVFITCGEYQGRKCGVNSYRRSSGSSLWGRTVSFGKVMRTRNTTPCRKSTPAGDRGRGNGVGSRFDSLTRRSRQFRVSDSVEQDEQKLANG